jgi:hypothetical protein
MKRLLSIVLLLSLLLPVSSWAAVAFGTIGTGGSGTTAPAPAYPASIAAGDLLVLCVVNKYPTNAPATPAGWTAPSNNTGTGDPGDGPGADVGATYATIYTKVATGGESGSVTVTITGGNSSYGFIARYTNATGAWLTAAANGGDTTSGTAWSATMGSDPGIAGGDMVVACSGKNNGVAIGASAEAITTTGITYGTATERGDNGTSFGDNVMAVVSDHVVTSGTSSAAPVYTFTNSLNSAGGTVILRIREDAAAAATLQSPSGFLGAIIK